jgi:fructose-specific phosphotransferase system IIC component
MHRLGELAIERGGVGAFIAGIIGGAIAWSITPMYVHHPTTTHFPSSLCSGGVCTSHLDLKTFNDAFAGAVIGGFFGGAIVGFLVIAFLVDIGVPRQYLGMPKE